MPYLQNAKNAGYNTAILSFYLPSGYPTAHNLPGAPVGSPLLYATATNGGYAPTKIPGLDVLMSVGGDQLIPPIDDLSFATAFGIEVGQFAANNGFDGLDFDIENMAFNSDLTVPWLIELTNRARESYFLIKGSIPIITHAPQSPYFNHAFAPSTVRDYTDFVRLIGDNVSWYNIQFYNQNHGQSEGVCTDDSGATIDCCYTTSIGLTTTSASDCPTNPDTSIAEIIAGGVPWQKLIVGKSIRASDGEGGQIFLPKTLKTLLTTTPETFYGGIMGWSWDGTAATFCNALYGAECT
jgi:chitinase